jgi:isopenicillin-N epimerase
VSLSESEWSDLRAQYLNDPDAIYMNTGSWGVMAKPVFDTYVGLLRELELNPTRNRSVLRKKLRESRTTFAEHLNIQAEDLAFLPNVTAAINMVVNGLDWEAGDEILTTDQEYGAILNCLDNASKRWGVKVVSAPIAVPPASTEDVLAPMEAAFTERTRLVVCSHITTRTGLITPIREIADLAHRRGALVAFDGAHAPGMIPLDIEASGADFYGGNCHKWLCSPKGVGFLYAKPAVQDRLHHLLVSWGYDAEGMQPGPERPQIKDAPAMWGLEAWGTTDLAAQGSVGEAIRFQGQVGIDEVSARGRELAGYLKSKIESMPWIQVQTPAVEGMYGSLTTCGLEGLGGIGLANSLLNDYRITIPVFEEGENAAIRVSTHLYNTFAEIDRLLEAVTTLRRATS